MAMEQAGPVSQPAKGEAGRPPAESLGKPYEPTVDPKSIKGYDSDYKPK